MKFLEKNFLLKNETAQMLYHNYAKDMPIFDYHCHLSPKEIYEDKKFRSITEAWLGGDHYKWRLLRQLGVDEEYITGSKSDREKFDKYAECMPYFIGNPIYQWTHLELKRYFDIDIPLSPETADVIWQKTNEKLETLTARKMMKMFNVRALCTTDDPSDTLEYHIKIKNDKSFDVSVLPAFRPDKYVYIELPAFFDWLPKLEKATGVEIKTLDALLDALEKRIKFFDEAGCVCSDHGLDVLQYVPCGKNDASNIFAKVMAGGKLSAEERAKFKSFMLVFFGKQYKKYGWAQQYHIGALRNSNSLMMAKLGADTGFDTIEDRVYARSLIDLLDKLNSEDSLPNTILYSLNPKDNEVLAAVMNCFQCGGVRGKIQFGSAWWFNDQRDGMERQLEALSQIGLLSPFIGMLTDSRSFLSYPRHEYFRRILCNKLGTLIEEGGYPNNIEFVGKIIQDICYTNAVNYFKS